MESKTYTVHDRQWTGCQWEIVRAWPATSLAEAQRLVRHYTPGTNDPYRLDHTLRIWDDARGCYVEE